MAKTGKTSMKDLWVAAGALGELSSGGYARVALVHSAIVMAVMVVMPLALLFALPFHSRGLAAVGMAAMAMFFASGAVREAFRIRLALALGRWSGWSGEPIGRAERPARFWTRTALWGVILALYAAGAIALVWFNPGWTAY